MRKLVLEGKSLSKTFRLGDGSIEVLSKADIALEEASSMSIRGDSGCGKTTLLNLLARLEDADEGKIGWDGHEMDASVTPSSSEAVMRARFIGVVYQAYYLIPELNVLENVLMAARLAGGLVSESCERARSLLSKMGVGDKEKQAPDKLSEASANGWPSPGPWSMNLESSWPTNQRATSTSERVGRSWIYCWMLAPNREPAWFS